jgi:hypothetical protein
MILSTTICTITPEKAQNILQENGLQVSLDQSKSILEFLVKLAQTSFCQDEDSMPLHSGEHRRAS